MQRRSQNCFEFEFVLKWFFNYVLDYHRTRGSMCEIRILLAYNKSQAVHSNARVSSILDSEPRCTRQCLRGKLHLPLTAPKSRQSSKTQPQSINNSILPYQTHFTSFQGHPSPLTPSLHTSPTDRLTHEVTFKIPQTGLAEAQLTHLARS